MHAVTGLNPASWLMAQLDIFPRKTSLVVYTNTRISWMTRTVKSTGYVIKPTEETIEEDAFREIREVCLETSAMSAIAMPLILGF